MDEQQRPAKSGSAGGQDPQLIADRFEVRGLLGEGPFAKVYRVSDHGAEGRSATLKIVRADAIAYDGLEERLAEHAAPLAELAHPNVQRLYDVGQTALGLLFVCGQDARGENLARLLERRGTLPEARAVAIARQVAAGLAAGHAAGRAHGDLRPENVLLLDRVPATDADPWGTRVLLLDYGFADLAGVGLSASPWAAPEVRAGGPPDAAADAWSLAALVCAMRGVAPPDGAEGEAPLLAGLPRVRAALAAEPETRPSLEALVAELEAWQGAEVEGDEAESAPRAAPTIPSPHPPGDPNEEEVVAAAASDSAPSPRPERPAHPDRPSPPRSPRERAAPARQPARAGYGLATAFALLAALALALWWNGRGRVEAAPPEVAELTDELEEARASGDEARAELAALRAASPDDADARAEAFAVELAAARDETARVSEALGQRVAAAERERDEWKRNEATARRRAEEAEERARVLEEERGELADALEAERGALAAAEGRLRELQLELDLSTDPEVLAASTVDRVLGAVTGDRAREARASYAALASDAQIVAAQLEGLAAIDALTRGAVALQRARDAVDPGDPAGTGDVRAEIEALEETAVHLARARSELDELAAAPPDWLVRDVGAAGGDDRVLRLDAAAEHVARGHAAAREDLSARLESLWLRFLAEDPVRAPGEVLAVADWFADGRAREFLAWYAAGLREAVEPEGQLDVPALVARRHLAAWAASVRARPELHADVAAREILLLGFARTFHDALPGETLPDGPVWFQDEAGDPPAGGWRAELAARARLLSEDTPWPGPAGARFLYRVVASAADGTRTESWRYDEVLDAVDRDGERTWTVRQSWYRADGGFLGERDVTFVRSGRRVVEDDRTANAIDLGGPGRLEVLEPPDVVPPDGLPVSADAVAAFAAEVGTLTCLRVGEDESVWLSPELGLARTDTGRLRRDLVFAELP